MNTINFKKSNGLIPAIIQDSTTNEVYMLGYMNRESLQKTISGGLATFWSRKRGTLWTKGEKSGNRLQVIRMHTDCDRDTLLIKVELIGTHVCHKGNRSCFNEELLINKIYI